jgi:hypothetical protein
MKIKCSILLVIFLLPFAAFCATGTVDSSYTYDYSQPPEFQPSLNSQFTALSGGVTDIMMNPAGIMHVNTIEGAVGISGFVQNPIRSDENKVYFDDVDMGGIQNSPNSRAAIRLTDDRSAVTSESRPITISEDYSKGGGINFFGMTYRFSDWLAVAISRRRPTTINFDYKMLAPVLMDAKANFRGTSFEAGGTGNYIQIRNDGTVEAVINGVAVTSEVAAWSGFLEQGTSEVNWANGTFDNSITTDNGIVITAAAKTGQFSWGLNIMPVNVELDLDNELSITSDSNNSNLKFYIPNLDFSSSEEATFWATSEVGDPSGYSSMEVETLPGQQIGGAKIAGKYSGSYARMDLGMQWEPADFFSAGAVYENFNNAVLELKGVGVIQYVEHRIDTSSKMPTAEGASYWNPFLDNPTHEADAESVIKNTLAMHPIQLPRKIKFGAALKKPILLAFDMEEWLNDYKFSSDRGHPETAHDITLGNISFTRIGVESRIAMLPMIIRGSITGMLKPSSDDKDTQDGIDDLFKSTPVVPVDGNIYLGFGVWDGELGIGAGGGGLPLMQALMLDMSSIMKVFYTNIYFMRGNWQISYLMTMDPVLTGFSSDISTSSGEESDVKLMSTSTLSLGFKF